MTENTFSPAAPAPAAPALDNDLLTENANLREELAATAAKLAQAKRENHELATRHAVTLGYLNLAVTVSQLFKLTSKGKAPCKARKQGRNLRRKTRILVVTH